jgi:hypothetical protein
MMFGLICQCYGGVPNSVITNLYGGKRGGGGGGVFMCPK